MCDALDHITYSVYTCIISAGADPGFENRGGRGGGVVYMYLGQFRGPLKISNVTCV